jgi:hypothetical protein
MIEQKRRHGQGSIKLRGKTWVLFVSNRRKGSRGPGQKYIRLGHIKDIPTIKEAEAAAAYVAHVGATTVTTLLRSRNISERPSLPTFSAEWFMQKLIEQEHKCAICRRTPKRLVVDHDHDDGQNRGLLCSSCNSGIGMLKDDIALLRAAVAYLESYGK